MAEEFEEGLGTEIRQQAGVEKKGERREEKNKYRRMELPGKYTAKLLYGWNDKKFKEKYLKKLEKNWNRWKNNRKIEENKYL